MNNRTILAKRSAVGISFYTLGLTKTATGFIINQGPCTISDRYGMFNTEGDVKKYNALIKKKLNEGYKDIITFGCNKLDADTERTMNLVLPRYNTDENNVYRAMKCQKFIADKFEYGPMSFAQPKINGNRASIRWTTIEDGLFSREGVIIKSHEGHTLTIEHIEKAFEVIYQNCSKNIVFDGELYVRKEPVASISGACKNVNNPIHSRLQYHCFDIAIPDTQQHERLRYRNNILNSTSSKQVYIQKHPRDHSSGMMDKFAVINVCTILVECDEESTDYRDTCITHGYEGAVIRNGAAEYKFGSRPKTMMKLKRALYGEFRVVDVTYYGESDINLTKVGKGAIFILANDLTDATFESKPIGKYEDQIEYYLNKKKYIGNSVTIKYFERTITNIPFQSNVIFNR